MSSTPLDVSSYGFTRHIRVAARPDQVYDLVSTVSNISKWSPNALHAEYEDGAGPRAGAWFRGRNHGSGRQWESRSQVTVAEPGAVFAFTVLGSASVPVVEWRWTFTARGSGTLVAQTWRLLVADPVLGSTYEDLDRLRDATVAGVEATLTSLADWVAGNVTAR
ncbi:SRPBCC family protein [Streptomyces sp. NPDC016626]|uniref:SRPBCC family protein n=1 Tax=Streptomyces sp. NPDC016626 TaxID=3364968 RepID=UPI0036F662E2